MGSKPLPRHSRHRDIQDTRSTLHFSLRSALALRAPHPKPGFKTQTCKQQRMPVLTGLAVPYKHMFGTGQLVCLQLLRKGVSRCNQLLSRKLQTGRDTARRAGTESLFQC